MDEPLHPSSLSEILDRTAQIYRSRFLVFLGIAVIPTAALVVFAAVAIVAVLRLGPIGGAAGSPALVGLLVVVMGFGVFLVVLPTMLAVTALAMAAMSHASARIFMGQPISIRDSYKAIWRRGWSYIGLFAFEIVVIWVVPMGAWFVLTLFSAALAPLAQGGAGGLLILVGLLVIAGLVSYGFWMTLRLSLAFPACVVEQIGAWDAIRRSSTLTMGSKGRILLLYLLGTALNWLLSLAIMVPLTIVMAMLPGANTPQHAQTMSIVAVLIVYGSAFAVQAFTRPVYGIALILFYYDQRIRQEAFDIEWMMLRAGLVVPPPQQPGTEPVIQPGPPAVSEPENPPARETAPVSSAEEPAESAPAPVPEPTPPDLPEHPLEPSEPTLGEPA